jgi:hypothetical protein
VPQSSDVYHLSDTSIRPTFYVSLLSKLTQLRLTSSGATTDIAIWSTIEQGLAITAGSLATLRPLFFLAMSRLGFSTQPSARRPSNYGLSGPPLNGSQPKPDKLRPDMYKLSAVVETRASNDSGPRDTEYPKSPNWFNVAGNGPKVPPKDAKKKSLKNHADNESQRSLQMKSSSSRSLDEEDGMHILVSKSFYITDEERSLATASRGNSYI